MLWTNPSPTSGFNSQTISLDLTNYDGAIIESYNATTIQTVSSRLYIKKNESLMCLGRQHTDFSNGFARNVKMTDSGIIFGNSLGSTNLNNNTVIPYKIYGVKGNLV